MRDDEVDAQVRHEQGRRRAMTLPTPADPNLPADPMNPRLADSEPAWARYVAGAIATLLLLLLKRLLDIDGDVQAATDALVPIVVFAFTTWSTRRKVYSPATVAKLEHWQASDHAGGQLPKSMMAERPEGTPGGQ